MELDLRPVEIILSRQFCFAKSLQSQNRINILVLRKLDFRIGVIIGLIRTSIVEFAGIRSKLETFGRKSIEN